MANFLSKLFGGSSEKRDASYTGPQPYAHLYDAPGGSDALAEFRRRLAGQGVGYGDAFATQASNPIIANMRAKYNSDVMPELVSELSATGRRRGSGGFAQLSKSLQGQALDEGDVFARAYMDNEQQKRSEINNALTGLERFGQNEVGVQGKYVDAQKADNEAQLRREDARRTARGGEIERALGFAQQAALMPFTGGASIVSPITSASSSQYGQMPFNPNANIGYGRSGNSLNQRLAIKKALQGGYR